MLKKLFLFISLLLVAAFAAFLWPVPFGGDTSYIMVTGDSMEPTMSQGDLALARRQASYEVGDILVYSSPYGPAVIHRIVGTDGEKFITRGDNNDSADPWAITPNVVLGKSFVAIPYVGNLFKILQEPLLLAAFMTALFITITVPGILLSTGLSRGKQRRLERMAKSRSRRRQRALARWLPPPLAWLLSRLG